MARRRLAAFVGTTAVQFLALGSLGADGIAPASTPVRYAGGGDRGLPRLTPSALANGGRGGASNAKPGQRLAADDHELHDPRPADYEPRLHPEDGGDKWAFGPAHAALMHVLQTANAGNATAAAEELDRFSAEHSLGLGLGVRGQAIDLATRRALAGLKARAAEQRGVSGEGGSQAPSAEEAAQSAAVEKTPSLHALVLGAGVGGAVLRVLPALLEEPATAPHELASVEAEVHLHDVCSQLVDHALGVSAEGDQGPSSAPSASVQHLPLMPGADTALHEVLETLRSGYELGPFHLVLLEGRDRSAQREQLRALLQTGSLALGAVVHAEGPGRGDADTEKLLQAMDSGREGGRLEYELLEDVWPGTATILARYVGGSAAGAAARAQEL